MEISAPELAGFVYGVSAGAVLAAAFRPDGGMSAVIDHGIHGAPKYSLGVQETAQAKTEYAKHGTASTGTEQRGTFTTPALPHESKAAAKNKRAAKVKQGA